MEVSLPLGRGWKWITGAGIESLGLGLDHGAGNESAGIRSFGLELDY